MRPPFKLDMLLAYVRNAEPRHGHGRPGTCDYCTVKLTAKRRGDGTFVVAESDDPCLPGFVVEAYRLNKEALRLPIAELANKSDRQGLRAVSARLSNAADILKININD